MVPGLVEQDDVDVTGRLDRATAHGQDVEARHAVHAGDADGGQQAADRGRDEAHEQGDEGDGVDRRARVLPERPQGDRRHQEDDGQTGEQDRQRDLVRRPLALGALDQGDHPVEEGLARIGRDHDDDPVADERRPAGDRAPDVRAGLLEDRRGFAGDRGLVDEPDALDDVAVAGDRLAFLDDDDVALAQLGRADVLERPVRRSTVRGRLRAGRAQGGRLGATARLGDGLGIGREQDGEPQPDRDLDREPEATRSRSPGRPVASAIAVSVTSTAVISTTNMTGFLISRRGSSLRNACGMADRSRSGIEHAPRLGRLAAMAWRHRA